MRGLLGIEGGHWGDRLYGRLSRGQGFFFEGWGDLSPWLGGALMERLKTPHRIEIEWEPARRVGGASVRQGRFASPLEASLLPIESRAAHVLEIRPSGHPRGPTCVHMAATGDEGFGRRLKTLATPLLEAGIGSIILENPYSGLRRPNGQRGVALARVSDLFAMGAASIMEGLALVDWLDRQGVRQIGVTGVSMGGQMAATVGALTPLPVALAPCIASHSAVPVFTEGMLSFGCDWEKLGATHASPRQAHEALRDLLEQTDLRQAPPPSPGVSVVQVAARRDAYVPQRCAHVIHRHFKGAELHWLDTGHVAGFVLHREAFIRAIRRAFERLDARR